MIRFQVAKWQTFYSRDIRDSGLRRNNVARESRKGAGFAARSVKPQPSWKTLKGRHERNAGPPIIKKKRGKKNTNKRNGLVFAEKKAPGNNSARPILDRNDDDEVG